MQIIRRIYPFALKYKLYIIIYVLFSIMCWGFEITIPILLGEFIDNLIEQANIEYVYKFSLFIFTMTLVVLIVSYNLNMIIVKLKLKLSYDIKKSLINNIMHVNQSTLDKFDLTYINQRISSDIDELVSFFINNTIQLFSSVLSIIFILAVILNYDIELAIILIFSVPIYIALYYKFKSILYSSAYKVKEANNKFFSKINYIVNNLYYIKIKNIYNDVNQYMDKSFDIMYNDNLNYAKKSYLFSVISSTINNFLRVILILIGGTKIINGTLSVGNFTVIVSYYSSFIAAVRYFFEFSKNYQSARVSYDRLNELDNLEPHKNGNNRIDKLKSIKISNLIYTINNNIIFQQSEDIIFEKNNTYCIVGNNGCGKTTLLNIILDIYKPTEGNIYINNIQTNNLDMMYIRENFISILTQETILFEEELELCNDFYEKELEYNKKLNVVKRENTNQYSGGEKQKRELSLILSSNRDCIILDEPTTYLDEISIEVLLNEINSIKKDKIIIFVSHDDKIKRYVDTVINV